MILGVLYSFLRSSFNRELRNALTIFLIKPKTNLSLNQIGTLFNFIGDSKICRKRIAGTFDSVRRLIRNFVPLNLAVSRLTREQALTHNTAFNFNCCKSTQ